jgi:hypothetical protein
MRERQLIYDLSTPLVAVAIAHVEWLYPLMPSYPLLSFLYMVITLQEHATMT